MKKIDKTAAPTADKTKKSTNNKPLSLSSKGASIATKSAHQPLLFPDFASDTTSTKSSIGKSNSEKIPAAGDEVRYSVSQMRQGEHRFYTFSIFSDVLAKCCFATNRDEDPINGFQRVLDNKRAKDIANYIDFEMGTIPNSIVLSAQTESKFKLVGQGKTASFIFDPHAFLIIDGQHRVYGYALAKTRLRVPVVVYENLTREQETRLFIDINTKQRPVPKELLLSIKSLAKTENDIEGLLGEIFDLFDQDQKSALIGLTSATKKVAAKISRVTFNAGLKPHLQIFSDRSADQIYLIWNSYFHAVLLGLREKKSEKSITNKTVFRAFCDVFLDCAERVKLRFSKKYTVDNFEAVSQPIFANIKQSTFTNPRMNQADLAEHFRQQLKSNFSL
ncbi:DndB-like protein [Collimonas arenae]|uniref:DndB-like protein n=1 Tax=Collimonas arenae TaxID=279058 RepID=A0A0A1F6Q2_9BURK|nr:DGQHR domain-containing protein [Collimonas arenae]AIY39485.1 DndB-like protein [Collimonas arenae]